MLAGAPHQQAPARRGASDDAGPALDQARLLQGAEEWRRIFADLLGRDLIEQVAEIGELGGLERQPGAGALPGPHHVVAVPLQAEADRREDVVAVAGRAGGRFAIAERPGRQRAGGGTVGALRQPRGGIKRWKVTSGIFFGCDSAMARTRESCWTQTDAPELTDQDAEGPDGCMPVPASCSRARIVCPQSEAAGSARRRQRRGDSRRDAPCRHRRSAPASARSRRDAPCRHRRSAPASGRSRRDVPCRHRRSAPASGRTRRDGPCRHPRSAPGSARRRRGGPCRRRPSAPVSARTRRDGPCRHRLSAPGSGRSRRGEPCRRRPSAPVSARTHRDGPCQIDDGGDASWIRRNIGRDPSLLFVPSLLHGEHPASSAIVDAMFPR